jgi:hemerythrin superfamily protein
MNALALLKSQHRLVEELFEELEANDQDEARQVIFEQIADCLAVHTAIEERIFYPAVRARQTEEELEEAYDEHLDAKKLILEALEDPNAPGFDGKVAALEGAIEHHVDEEEDELFPEVEKLLTAEALEALGQMMEAETAHLMETGAPRRTIELKPEAPEPTLYA